MWDELILVQKILASILVGYLLGSIPFAHVAARLNGVDIFATGSGQAGTANVFWNVGRRIGVLVFVGDIAKGSVAVLVAQLMDIPSPLVLLAGTAAVMGHWKSIFTGFRGGDGMATLLGVTITLAPVLAAIGIAAGLVVVILRWRSTMRSAWGIGTCYVAVLAASLVYDTHFVLVLGLALLAGLVLWHNIVMHRRLDHYESADILDENAGADSSMDTTAPQNH